MSKRSYWSQTNIVEMCIANTNKTYVCINCGAKTAALYKKYNASVLKLINCDSCGSVVDKYIEYDPVIIIIDLVLLNREAYRHVLYNTEFNIHWKLTVILILMEAYAEYILDTKRKHTTIDREVTTTDLLFYKMLFKIALQTSGFIVTVFLLTKIYNKFLDDSRKVTATKVWNCVAFSSFGIFLLLPSLIWYNNVIEEFHVIFVYLYTILSQLLAYTVLCECPKLWSILVVISSYLVKAYSQKLTSKIL